MFCKKFFWKISQSLFLDKIAGCRPVTWLKRDPDTIASLWKLWNLSGRFFFVEHVLLGPR